MSTYLKHKYLQKEKNQPGFTAAGLQCYSEVPCQIICGIEIWNKVLVSRRGVSENKLKFICVMFFSEGVDLSTLQHLKCQSRLDKHSKPHLKKNMCFTAQNATFNYLEYWNIKCCILFFRENTSGTCLCTTSILLASETIFGDFSKHAIWLDSGAYD